MSNGANALGLRGWLAIASSLATILTFILAVLTFTDPFGKEDTLSLDHQQETPSPTQAGPSEPTVTPPPTSQPTSTSIGTLDLDMVTPSEPTPTSTSALESGTVTPSATKHPTATPTPPPNKYPSPELLGPPDAYAVAWKSAVTLKWRSVGRLTADEYYHLHLDAYREMDGEHWYGDYIYTKDTTHPIDPVFLAPFHPPDEHGRAVVYWWVQVARKTGEDENGKPLGVDIGEASGKRTFVTESKPPGQ